MLNDNFFDRVYAVVRLIPPGRVSTFGAIARYAGAASSARMVGWALNASSAQKDFVPAHRVVNRFGHLTGKRHFGSRNAMQQLLESEGIRIEDDRIIDFENVLWIPE